MDNGFFFLLYFLLAIAVTGFIETFDDKYTSSPLPRRERQGEGESNNQQLKTKNFS